MAEFLLRKQRLFSTEDTVDASELGFWLNLDVDEVERLAEAGVLRQMKDGRFPIVECALCLNGNSVWRGFFGRRRWPKRATIAEALRDLAGNPKRARKTADARSSAPSQATRRAKRETEGRA